MTHLTPWVAVGSLRLSTSSLCPASLLGLSSDPSPGTQTPPISLLPSYRLFLCFTLPMIQRPWGRPAVLFEHSLQVMGVAFRDLRALMGDSCFHSLACFTPLSGHPAPLYTCVHETQLTDSASHHVLHTSLLMETVLAFGDGHAASLVLFGHRAVLVNEVVCIYVRRKSS